MRTRRAIEVLILIEVGRVLWRHGLAQRHFWQVRKTNQAAVFAWHHGIAHHIDVGQTGSLKDALEEIAQTFHRVGEAFRRGALRRIAVDQFLRNRAKWSPIRSKIRWSRKNACSSRESLTHNLQRRLNKHVAGVVYNAKGT